MLRVRFHSGFSRGLLMPLGSPMSHNHTTGAGASVSCPHAVPHPAPRGLAVQTWCRRWAGPEQVGRESLGARAAAGRTAEQLWFVQGEGSCCSGRIWVTLQEELGTVTHQTEGESPPGRETTPAGGAAKSRMVRPSLWPPGDRRGLFCMFLEGLF